MDDPKARKLLFDMYDDVCEATKGCRYFLVSTDEVYYAGICEKYRAPYNDENRSLTLVDYVNAAHAHLSGKGRRVIIWLEYPLLAEHVKLLPPDILNGVGFHDAGRNAEERARGIRSFVYVPMQGSELTFPTYFGGHLDAAARAVPDGALRGAEPLGIIAAAWDDAGLHNETFWLGWAAAAACGWNPGAQGPEDTAAAFMEIYYPGAEGMAEIYRDLQDQARFCENALEKLPSKVRGPSYGHPYWKGPMDRYDRTMMPPAEPRTPNDTAVAMAPVFGPRYREAVAQAPSRLEENGRLLERLKGNLDRTRRNRYGIEVLISLAEHLGHFMRMVITVADAERTLHHAAELARQGRDNRGALDGMRCARDTVRAVVDDLYAVQERLTEVWERSRLPRNAPAGGREFLHVMDDVKDHFADRRPDMSYLIAPEENIGLRDWLARLDDVIARFEAAIGC
jgi:hypothetical protein